MHPLTHTHLLFCLRTGPSQSEVTGILGTNITLQFTFDVNVTKQSHFAVYIGPYIEKKKIAEYSQGKGGGIFDVYPKNNSAFYHITNLKLNNRGSYWATVFMTSGPVRESNMVMLIVREENISSTGEVRLFVCRLYFQDPDTT